MWQVSNLALQILLGRIFIDQISIFGELEEELIEVGRNIDALTPWVVKLIHQDEIRIKFYPTIFANDKTHLVLLIRFSIDLAYGSVLQKF